MVRLLPSRNIKQKIKCKGRVWKSKAIDFIKAVNISRDNSLLIKARSKNGEVKVRVQLLDNIRDANKKKGLAEKELIVGNKSEERSISLSEFKKVDLRKVKRVAFHYGRKLWGEKFNDTNDEEIVIHIVKTE